MMYALNGNGWEDADTTIRDGLHGFAYGDFSEEVSVSIEAGEQDRECPECGAFIDEDAEATCGDENCDCGSTAYVEGHDGDCSMPDWRPPDTMGDYFNGAGVRVSEEAQRVQVWISVGDPRGAFTMDLEPVKKDDGTTELRLSVPSPSDSLAHATLRPLSEYSGDGSYKIVGSYGEPLPDLRRTASEALKAWDNGVLLDPKDANDLRDALGRSE